MDAGHNLEAARQIGGLDHPLLGAQQARQDDRAAGDQGALDVLGQADQRTGQDVGEDQIVGCVLGDQLVGQARGVDEARIGLVDLSVLLGDPHGRLVDVGADGQLRARASGGNGQQARAGADIQHLVEPARLDQAVIGLQTADGRAVVTGAEGRAGLDAQIDGAGRQAATVVHAVDEEATRSHRRQARQRHGQPVGVGQGVARDLQVVLRQQRHHAFVFVFRGREGVDAPDVLVLVLFQDRVGRAFEARMVVDGVGGGLGFDARTAGDDLLGRIVGHDAPTRARRPKKRAFSASSCRWRPHRPAPWEPAEPRDPRAKRCPGYRRAGRASLGYPG